MSKVTQLNILKKLMWDEEVNESELEGGAEESLPTDDDLAEDLSIDDAEFDDDMDVELPNEDLE